MVLGGAGRGLALSRAHCRDLLAPSFGHAAVIARPEGSERGS
jgi:hypothetical protein